ncbi:hypothetical protein ACWD6N_08270 [Micromonospora sp. NPDC005163]
MITDERTLGTMEREHIRLDGRNRALRTGGMDVVDLVEEYLADYDTTGWTRGPWLSDQRSGE